MTDTTTPDFLRDFIRANQALPGALDAWNAMLDLQTRADAAAHERARVQAFNKSMVAAQHKARAAVKDSEVKLGGAGSYNVAETEQLIKIAREVFGEFGLALALGDTEIIELRGAMGLRVRLGVRHELGHVEWSSQEWPVDLGGGPIKAANARRGAETSAIGYYLRGQLGLQRDEQSSERGMAGEQGPRSGPSGRSRPAPRAPSSSPRRESGTPSEGVSPDTAPAVAGSSERISARAEKVIAGIREAKADQLEAVAGKVADQRAALDGDEPTYSLPEVRAMEAALEERRKELGA